MKARLARGFSLVEVTLAIGIIAFALLTIFALLPVGLQSNRTSTEETRANGILTEMEADLRNSYPTAANPRSRYFGLPLPYILDGTGRVTLNTALSASVGTANPGLASSPGLDENETVIVAPVAGGASYQVTVVYERVLTSDSLAPIEARLIVSWPYVGTVNAAKLTTPGVVSGFVESYVTFPAP